PFPTRRSSDLVSCFDFFLSCRSSTKIFLQWSSIPRYAIRPPSGDILKLLFSGFTKKSSPGINSFAPCLFPQETEAIQKHTANTQIKHLNIFQSYCIQILLFFDKISYMQPYFYKDIAISQLIPIFAHDLI